ncbi:transposase domain-containing protein [Streptomyces sp. DSM 41972]|uniref:Transposase domain-containing protein n=1 Tax=Streptomyces althioticus subsp. attaecolombicae TaxID=3075534 RepID=A0ABU3I1C3_9ACTN|nr:transposase domain-containing protein [Streptomyces sp. DSM 41972]SCD31261.1 Insertion element 4 transposase N-terminal [Streptomyces sp. di50b]SCE29453.1 Insertion element 4 transposase N-terminal [Streptomyces sp. di188]
MREKSGIAPTVETAARGVFAPGRPGESAQVVDSALVGAVLDGTGRCEKRLRLLLSQVVVHVVLALAFFT